MRITVKLYATLRRYRPEASSQEGFPLDVAAGSDVEQVAECLGIPAEAPFVAMVNDQVVHVDYVLAASDRLSLFPPVGGG